MADDFVLNFDTPSTAGPSQTATRQPRQKGGRWTDRAKEKRFNKLKQQNPRAANSQGQPTTTTNNSPTEARAKVPGSRTNNRDSTQSTKSSGGGQSSGTGGGGGGGRRLEQAVGPSGKKQFISSLFTADGLPTTSTTSTSSSTTPLVPVKPSNAPLTHTPTENEDDEEEEEEADPAPELTKLGLMKELVTALSTKLGITGPTACQAGAIPRLVVSPSPSKKKKQTNNNEFEHDAILRAQTGSGKTLTFLLPMLQDLLTLPPLPPAPFPVPVPRRIPNGALFAFSLPLGAKLLLLIA